MNLDTLRPLFFGPIKDIKPGTDNDRADRYLNLAYKEVYRAHRWEYRKRTGQITIIPKYTTGTCTVTKFNGTNESAARTVVFAGATLSDSMRGRYLKVSGSSKWHKIVYISGSTAYLDTPIVDIESAGSLTFDIWKRFYYLKSDVEEVLDFGKWGDGVLSYAPDIQTKHTDISKTGSAPYEFNVYGVDPFNDLTYSTGTIQIPADSNVMTGTSTAWLSAGFDSGDIVEIGSNRYPINRVESDTRIILVNYQSEAVTAGSLYTLRKNNPLGIEIYNTTNAYNVLPYTYLAKPYDLIHVTKDYIALTDRFIQAIVSRAHYYAFNDAKDDRAITELKVYDGELLGLKSKVSVVNSRYTQFAPKIPSFMPGRS